VEPIDLRRITFWRGVFYLIMAVGLTLMVIRYTQGLGRVTNLSAALTDWAGSLAPSSIRSSNRLPRIPP